MPFSTSLADRTAPLRRSFLAASPFRHVAVENFFDDTFANRLLDEFPSFDKGDSKAESGKAGGKAVNTRIAAISPAWEELYREISAAPFLDLISQLSGIEDLILDPTMYGGGTHENRDGQELDPHVDFNYDESQQLHRRLNLIVYLNKTWKPEWGGGLEIHSNPRRPEENEITTYDPLFNRGILFETNEYSWHGFPKIVLPEDQRHLSRKSISIYLYTKDRPAAEIAPMHATFYVQRPLARRFSEGHTLTPEDVHELRRQFIRRDHWIEFYQRKELEANATIRNLQDHLVEVAGAGAIPITGYVKQDGCATGFHGDRWTEPTAGARLQPLQPVAKLRLEGFRTEGSAEGSIAIRIDGIEVGRGAALAGRFTVECTLARPRTEPFELEVQFEGPLTAGLPATDSRRLAYMLLELRALHPWTSAFRQR